MSAKGTKESATLHTVGVIKKYIFSFSFPLLVDRSVPFHSPMAPGARELELLVRTYSRSCKQNVELSAGLS